MERPHRDDMTVKSDMWFRKVMGKVGGVARMAASREFGLVGEMRRLVEEDEIMGWTAEEIGEKFKEGLPDVLAGFGEVPGVVRVRPVFVRDQGGFEIVDNALDIAHHNSSMWDIVQLSETDFEDLGQLDVPVNPSKEEMEDFYMEVAY